MQVPSLDKERLCRKEKALVERSGTLDSPQGIGSSPMV